MAWLEEHRIEPQWDCDIFQPPTLPNPRPDLLRLVLEFVRSARQRAGVQRIALLGSLATDKRQPKDDDLQHVHLDRETIAHPPIELWPRPSPGHSDVAISIDLAEILLAPLQADASSLPPPS